MQKMTLLFIQCYEYRFQGRPVHTLPAHVIIVSEADTCALSGIQVLILSTPIISIIIYVCLPLQHLFLIDNILFYELLIFCLVLLNIINYILIQKEYASTTLKYTNAQMEDQIRFQKEKYEQLSESYRQSRRIIHDLKSSISVSTNMSTTRNTIN